MLIFVLRYVPFLHYNTHHEDEKKNLPRVHGACFANLLVKLNFPHDYPNLHMPSAGRWHASNADGENLVGTKNSIKCVGRHVGKAQLFTLIFKLFELLASLMNTIAKGFGL